jgi:hypothetical protein
MGKLSGSWLTNVVAERRAATIRVGSTSVAFIDPDTSMTRTTVACSLGTATVACGRPSPTSIAARASR